MPLTADFRQTKLEYFESTTHERTGVVAPIVFKDDFFGADTVIPAAGSPESGCKWVKKIVGAAPPTLAKKADAHTILCSLTVDAQKQNAELYMDDQRQFLLTAGLVFEARFRLPTLPTLAAEAVIGLVGDWTDGLDSATYSAFVTCDGSGEIICETDDNATDASATSGVTLIADEWCIVRIDFSDIANIAFYVNGARVATGTTFGYVATGANATLQPVAGMYKVSGAGLGVLEVDYIAIWGTR